MLVCGCLLRTQQCVELVCSELVVLCQFDDCASMCPRPRLWCRGLLGPVFVGEFDPGSGRTLAACLTHASRTERPACGYSSGERVSNTWATCPQLWDNSGKPVLILDIDFCLAWGVVESFSAGDGPAAYQLVGGVMAYQGDDG